MNIHKKRTICIIAGGIIVIGVIGSLLMRKKSPYADTYIAPPVPTVTKLAPTPATTAQKTPVAPKAGTAKKKK